MKTAVRVCVLVPLLACAACSDDSSTSSGADTDSGGGSDSDVAAFPDTPIPDDGQDVGDVAELPSFSVTFPAVPAAPLEEQTRCVIMRLGNPEPIHVNRIRNVLGATSHHYIVYATNETQERREPFECFPFVDTLDPEAGAPLMITQRAEETLELPATVGYTFEADQMIRLELHYINLQDETVDVTATTTFQAMAEDDFELEADFLFIGSIDVSIPRGQSATLGPVRFSLPSNLVGSQFWGLTGHTHQWGTDVSIALADSDGNAVRDVYDIPDWDWDEPETVTFDPPFEVPTGGGLNFSCSWENLSNRDVGFGESANDEMCFFWAYYYPSRGAFVCFHTDQFGGIDSCCPGGQFCELIESFF